MEKDREKIEELEQTLFELRGEIGAGRHVPPGVRVLPLSMNPAQEWANLRQPHSTDSKKKTRRHSNASPPSHLPLPIPIPIPIPIPSARKKRN